MHLKAIIVLISCFFIATCSFCQQRITDFFADVKIQHAPQAYVLYNVPFKARVLTVTDNRPDTVEIGLFRTMGNEDGALRPYEHENIQEIFKRMFVADTGTTELRLVLNHFFITTPPLERNVNYQSDGGYNFPCMLTVNAKVYIKQQGYWQGLLRVDTSFTINAAVEKKFNLLLDKFAEHLSKSIKSAVDTKSYIRHPHLTDKNIDSLNTPATPKPLGQGDSSGVFMTFSDFMNGNITRTNLNLVETRPGIVYLYYVEKGNTETLVRDAWGAVKSGTMYIFRQNAFSPLVKVNNAWFWKEIYGYRGGRASLLPNYALALATGSTASAGVPKDNSNTNYMFKAFMLNMQTGTGH